MAKKTRTRSAQDRTGRAPHREQQARPLVIVVGEGQSEDQYVRALAQHRYDGKIALRVHKQPGKTNARRTDLRSLVKSARDAEKASPQCRSVWIICDRDDNERHRPSLDRWLKDAHRTRRRPKHGHCLNIPDLEYWILLHFEAAPKCTNAKDGERMLQQGPLPNYRKGTEFTASTIADVRVACERARKRNQESGCTEDGVADQDPWQAIRWSGMVEFIEDCDTLAELTSEGVGGAGDKHHAGKG